MPSLTPESRSQLLAAIRADQSDHWQRGERVRIEHYLSQHPELASDSEALGDLIYAEVLLRLSEGGLVSLDEYLGRFPAHAEPLRLRWSQFCRAHPELGREVHPAEHTVSEERTEASGVVTTRDAAPPLHLSGFTIEKKLGEGGMGIVFRARQVDLDRVVALKLIRAGPLASEHLLARFHTEERAVARLDHPGVVRIHSTGHAAGWVYFCMEYVASGSLSARLREGPMDMQQAAVLVRQLALAVHHAHEAGVLHRDLKPSNVLLTANGAPKVTDFGLAKLLDSDEGLTHTGAVLGTPSYMAPEQAEASTDIGPAADLYALGAILYECLTGKPPFKSPTRTQTVELVKTQRPVPPRQLRAEVPEKLEAICLKCLEKDPHSRYASGAHLAVDLENWQAGRAVAAHPPAWQRVLRRTGRWAAGHQGIVAACVVLAAVALLAPIFYRAKPRPDPLVELQAALKKGQTVELIGATGKPRWIRPWIGGETDVTGLEKDGTFAINGWRLSLFELLPSVPLDRYLIHAEIRHLKGEEDNAVGLYFAGTTQQTSVAARSFFRVTFNDLIDLPTQEAARFAKLIPKIRPLSSLPKANRVSVFSHYEFDLKERAPYTSGHFSRELFKPAGNRFKAGAWRTIRIEVSPERARIYWEGATLVGDLDVVQAEKTEGRSIMMIRKKLADRPHLVGLSSYRDMRGSFGLYLDGSSASYRNVRVEPVAAPENAR
jgi:serine/threonine-protein kinase